MILISISFSTCSWVQHLVFIVFGCAFVNLLHDTDIKHIVQPYS